MRPNFTFGPIDSITQYLLYLSIVVLGILLPLLVQRWRTRREKARLLARTLAALRDEIGANRRRMVSSRESFVALRDELAAQREHYLVMRRRLVDARGDGPEPQPPPERDLGINLALTTRTAWDVARLADALVLLALEQLEQFTRAYQMQELFEKDRSHLLEIAMQGEVLGLPFDMKRVDAVDARLAQLATAHAVLRYQVGLAESLIAAYDGALAKVPAA
jgi:hypothetical protein